MVAGRVRGVTAARRLLQSPTTSNDSSDPPPPPPPPAPQQQQQQEQQQQQQPPAAPPPAAQQAAQEETDFSEYAALDANITYCASTTSQTIVLETPEYSAHALLDDCLTARSLQVGALHCCVFACRSHQLYAHACDSIGQSLQRSSTQHKRSSCGPLIAVTVALLQLRILTNQYTVLPAAAGYLPPAGASGSAQSHGFTATIGVQLPTHSCPCTVTCVGFQSIVQLSLPTCFCWVMHHDSPDAVVS